MTVCKNPRCRESFAPNRTGRPKEYCGKRCRDAAYRAAQAAPGAHEEWYAGHVRETADAVERRAADLARTVRADDREGRVPLLGLRAARELCRDLEDLIALLVQQSRDRRVARDEIARALGVSSRELARRWPAAGVARRVERREGRRRGGGRPGPARARREQRNPTGPDPDAWALSPWADPPPHVLPLRPFAASEKEMTPCS